jgi:hypothetical protein
VPSLLEKGTERTSSFSRCLSVEVNSSAIRTAVCLRGLARTNLVLIASSYNTLATLPSATPLKVVCCLVGQRTDASPAPSP